MAMIRLRAGVSFALAEAMDDGHCGLPTEELIPLAENLLEAPADLISTAVDLERSEGTLVADRVGEAPCMFLAGLYRAEQAIAERLTKIAGGALPWPDIDGTKAIAWVESRTGLQLAETQREAIGLALKSKALVVTGGPGVGKTTIVNSILRILGAKGVRRLCHVAGATSAKCQRLMDGQAAATAVRHVVIATPRSARCVWAEMRWR